MRLVRHSLASYFPFTLSAAPLAGAFLALTILNLSIIQPADAQETRASVRLAGDKPLKRRVKQESKQELRQDAPRIVDLQTPDGLDFQAPPAAFPARDGHIILTSSAEVWIPHNQFIELMPNALLPGFTAVALVVFVDGQRTQVIGVERAQEIPVVRVDPPVGGSNRKRIVIVACDAMGNTRPVMHCNVRARLFAPAVSLHIQKLENEAVCTLSLENRDSLTEVHLYLEDMYLGHIAETTDTINLDTRHLLAGTYHFRILAKNVDGILLPEMRAAFVVPERYKPTDASPSATLKSSFKATEPVGIADAHL